MNSKVKSAARIFLGLNYLVFGLNGFLQFIPLPPLPAEAGAFLGALAATGYFFPILKGTEILMSLLLLSGFAAPVALVILAPITLQIFLFHTILTPGLQNAVLPIIMVVVHIIAALGYWRFYEPLFKKQSVQ